MPENLTAAQSASLLREVGAQLMVRGWLSANNVVFRGDDAEPATVVDTGYSTHADQTTALVRSALAGKPLSRIVNTHLHSDHCGGNAALCRAWPETQISVPIGYQGAVQPWNEDKLTYRLTGQQCEPFEVRSFLRTGEPVVLGGREWQVHATPGHDPDAVVLFEPIARILISGDALWSRRLAIIFPALEDDAGFDEANLALNLIEHLAPRLVLPGHGEAFTDVTGAIAQSRARLEAFARDPQRHRAHAVRALVTYRMLELGRAERAALTDWIVTTPVFIQAFRRSIDSSDLGIQAEATLDRLIRDGHLRVDGGFVSLDSR